MEFLVLLLAGIIFAIALGLIVLRFLKICEPNEVLVVSGRFVRRGRQKVGYRLVHGGRKFVIPLVEQVNRLDLTNMVIDVKVRGSYSKGGIPLNVDAVANVKIASQEPFIGNAIERFLGKHRQEIIRVAKDTLEGNLRGVLATLTPEEVNNDRVKFAQSLLHEADSDLKKLGIELDTLKIQNVSDDKGYLDSIGRKQTAELMRKSRVAEAENRAQSREKNSENHENKEVARIQSEMEILHADADKRIRDAQTKKIAMVAEQRGEVEALIAKYEAELAVQRARIEQVKLQLEADRIRPAEAKRAQMVQQARALAAPIVEEGKATAQSLRNVSTAWKGAGDDARRIFVAQKIGTLVDQMLDTVKNKQIDRVTVIDSKLAGSNGSSNLATKAMVMNEQLKETLGVDLPEVIRGLSPSTELKSEPAPALQPPAPPTNG